MARLNLESDIRPVSEFRAKAAELLSQVRATGRPLVLTQRGRGAAVVLSISEYERILDELELLRDIRTAEEQLEQGQAVPHAKALQAVLNRLAE